MYMYINMYIHMITYVINSHFGGGNTNDHPLDLDNTWIPACFSDPLPSEHHDSQGTMAGGAMVGSFFGAPAQASTHHRTHHFAQEGTKVNGKLTPGSA